MIFVYCAVHLWTKGNHPSRFQTHVANAYTEDILVSLTKDRIELVEKTTNTAAEAGAFGNQAGLSMERNKKFDINQIQVPGYITIKRGSYFSFHDYGERGPVYITIKTPGKFGLETLHYNVQVGNDQSVLVDEEGYLLNVLYGKIWTDISGKCHKESLRTSIQPHKKPAPSYRACCICSTCETKESHSDILPTHVANAYAKDINISLVGNWMEETKQAGCQVRITIEQNNDDVDGQSQVLTFVTIKSGSYFSFPSSADNKWPVDATIETLENDFQPRNVLLQSGQSLLVDEKGDLRNVRLGNIWTDVSGICHKESQRSHPIRFQSHVANAYTEDIIVSLTKYRTEGTEKTSDSEESNNSSKAVSTTNQSNDTGRVAISSGSYFSLHDYVADGPVYITVETRGKNNGSRDGETLHSNVQVAKDQGVLVDQSGYLLNVRHGTIWTDISGKCHSLQETTVC